MAYIHAMVTEIGSKPEEVLVYSQEEWPEQITLWKWCKPNAPSNATQIYGIGREKGERGCLFCGGKVKMQTIFSLVSSKSVYEYLLEDRRQHHQPETEKEGVIQTLQGNQGINMYSQVNQREDV